MLTQTILKERFDYDNGELIWKIRPSNRVQIGDVAGYIDNNGRKIIKIDNKLYKAHRLIFLWHHGWLPDLVDHKDENPLNNRIDNLRSLDRAGNATNSSKKWGSNPSRGIRLTSSGKYQARYKGLSLGSFESLPEAVLAYDAVRSCVLSL